MPARNPGASGSKTSASSYEQKWSVLLVWPSRPSSQPAMAATAARLWAQKAARSSLAARRAPPVRAGAWLCMCAVAGGRVVRVMAENCVACAAPRADRPGDPSRRPPACRHDLRRSCGPARARPFAPGGVAAGTGRRQQPPDDLARGRCLAEAPCRHPSHASRTSGIRGGGGISGGAAASCPAAQQLLRVVKVEWRLRGTRASQVHWRRSACAPSREVAMAGSPAQGGPAAGAAERQGTGGRRRPGSRGGAEACSEGDGLRGRTPRPQGPERDLRRMSRRSPRCRAAPAGPEGSTGSVCLLRHSQRAVGDAV